MPQHLWPSGMGSSLLWGLLSLAESMSKGGFSYRFGSLEQELREVGGERALGISQYLL